MVLAREGDDEIQAEIDRVNQWCDEACDKWYGENRRRDEHFGLAIAAGQEGAPDAKERLLRLLGKRDAEAPYLARATALQVLMNIDPAAAAIEAAKALEDEHPLVRATATAALFGNPSQTQSVSLLEKALSDPIRSVRTEAARNLLEYRRELWSESASSAFRSALTELTEGLEYNNDRAGAHMALGILAERQGRERQAITHYETAIAVEPGVTGPRTNLASLLENTLNGQSATTGNSNSPLQQEIERLRKQELPLLKRDVDLLPTAAPLQYRYGLALYVDGQREQAVEHLKMAAELEPQESGYAQAVAMLYETLGQWDNALHWARQAVESSAGDPQAILLYQRIEQGAKP
jgi:tetratricopeptide (TPR) repeat protein